MKWTVIGADRDSGADVRLFFEAASRQDAGRRATAGGVLVEHVLAEGEAVSPKQVPPPVVNYVAQPVEPPPTDAARVPCPSCAEPILPAASICPFCKQAVFARSPGRNAAIGLVATVVAFFVLYFAISAFSEHEAKRETDRIWKESREQTEQVMKDVQRDTDKAMRDAQRDMDAAMRKAAGQ